MVPFVWLKNDMTTLKNNFTWQALIQHQKTMARVHIRDLFAQEENRFERFSCEAPGLFLDYSKNFITDETQRLLIQLAEERNLNSAIESLFAGENINGSEERPALHMALRAPIDQIVIVNNRNIIPDIHANLLKMQDIVTRVREKKYLGFSGEAITDVIHIGIGGSDLGPALAYDALSPYIDTVRCHFISIYDVLTIRSLLTQLNPATTLVIIVSKSFTTQETLAAAEFIKHWLFRASPNVELAKPQLIGVTTVIEQAKTFGILPENILPIEKWVGGRFSLWSAVGLSIAIAIGMESFRQLLAGAYAMDIHFRNTPFSQNVPVILGVLGIWYNNFFSAKTHAIIPYGSHLNRLPTYLQQLHMESQGKCVQQNGESIDYETGTIIWGGTGTNSQHSFHQLLMQGTHLVPVDFVLPITVDSFKLDESRLQLIAHCLAQSRILMQGYLAEEILQDFQQQFSLVPHQVIPGNGPSNTILLPQLTPYSLGALLALYEHKVFTQSVIWGINPFDQWGVEQGKQLAKGLLRDLQSQHMDDTHDSSTRGLMCKIFHFHQTNKI